MNLISALFCLLFFTVPLFFSSQTSELFEYNKIMLTYAITIAIVTTWGCKMIKAQKFIYKHTLLEIPLLLYLASHIISTIFSIDLHLSLWGYYSRFHEGLFASISYILLYFAAVSNLTKEDVKKIFYCSFAAAVIISVWGAMEHFGNSPSCMLITGKAGVDCWVQDVQNRVYATLGQPNWMAAYLAILIPIVLSLKNRWSFLSALFFAALLFTKSRSGVLGLGVGLGIYLLFSLKQINKSLIFLLSLLILPALLFGLPFPQTDQYSIEKILTKNDKVVAQKQAAAANPEINISESGDIRKVVWTGAFKVWQRYPIFGSGVETFAYSYYKDRPVEHNLLSEWDFLYNKAHNEYLNILATTGTVGIIAYFGVIGTYVYWVIKNIVIARNEKKIATLPSVARNDTLICALFAAWVTILITNFFGFSVVIIGLYFFLIPAFSILLHEKS